MSTSSQVQPACNAATDTCTCGACVYTDTYDPVTGNYAGKQLSCQACTRVADVLFQENSQDLAALDAGEGEGGGGM